LSVEFAFNTRDDGQVDARIVGDYPLLNHALADSISSLPPRGETGAGPSTYWIDVARKGAVNAARDRSERLFTGGNITLLRVRGDEVEARYDYDDDDVAGETIPLADFLSLLEEWRSRVETSARNARMPLAETYRRNPAR
jgi:hypothetical protein